MPTMCSKQTLSGAANTDGILTYKGFKPPFPRQVLYSAILSSTEQYKGLQPPWRPEKETK